MPMVLTDEIRAVLRDLSLQKVAVGIEAVVVVVVAAAAVEVALVAAATAAVVVVVVKPAMTVRTVVILRMYVAKVYKKPASIRI